jgi:hypothetical protein
VGIFAPTAVQGQSSPKPASFAGLAAPVVKKFCVSCHSGTDPAAGIDLAKALKSPPTADLGLWARVAKNVSNLHMPPEGSPHPTPAQRQALKAAIDGLAVNAGPGHVTVRRLNRAEYNNTVRDLLGVDLHLADNFPSDDVGYGFDNIGDVLSVSSLLSEKYLDAAITLAKAAIPVQATTVLRKTGAEFSTTRGSEERAGGERFMSVNGTVRTTMYIPDDGEYRLLIQARGELAGNEPPKMRITVDRNVVQTFDLSSTKTLPYEAPVKLTKGPHQFSVSYINDYYNEATKADRNMAFSSFEVSGPILSENRHPASYTRIIPHPVAPDDFAREVPGMISRFASRAYRRPATADEVARLKKVFDAATKVGGTLDEGMQAVVAATLISPQFLFRMEAAPVGQGAGKVRALNDYELASRLSYFLWSSMPDDRLLDLAQHGELKKPGVLDAEVKRMLDDPRSHALADNFAEQWLQLRKLANFAPDRAQFPEVDAAMKADMAKETKLFFEAVVGGDRSVIDFLNGKYTFVDERLAKFYGIEGVTGEQFRKVALTDPNRGGILTQASVLSVTSNPTRTSPTKRGKWILEEVLGTPPPPPPPGVGTIANEKAALTATTLRKLMEEHRKNPTCAACHAQMDPLGFGLENFDPVGKWRTKEGQFPIDSSGTLPSGKVFHGPAELRTILLSQKGQFLRAFTEKLMTYALGRGVEATDGVTIEKALKREAPSGYRFSAVVGAIVHSAPFLSQGA